MAVSGEHGCRILVGGKVPMGILLGPMIAHIHVLRRMRETNRIGASSSSTSRRKRDCEAHTFADDRFWSALHSVFVGMTTCEDRRPAAGRSTPVRESRFHRDGACSGFHADYDSDQRALHLQLYLMSTAGLVSTREDNVTAILANPCGALGLLFLKVASYCRVISLYGALFVMPVWRHGCGYEGLPEPQSFSGASEPVVAGGQFCRMRSELWLVAFQNPGNAQKREAR